MSSANKHKNGSLEDAFKRRMQDAEAKPASDLWSRIDHDLTVQENVTYKKRAVFYRQLAAACFVLLMLAGSVLVYQYNTAVLSPEIAQQDSPVGADDNAIAGIAQPESSEASEEQVPAIQDTPEPVKGHSLAQVLNSERNKNNSVGSESSATQHNKQVLSSQTIAMGSDKEAGNEGTSGEHVTGKSGSNEIAVVSSSESKPIEQVSSLKPAALVPNPAVLSLMVKDQQKVSDFAGDDKPDALQQAKALALELNGDAKSGKESDKKVGNSRWSMSMAYMPTYFAQNIGLPEQKVSPMGRFSFVSDSPAISAEASANMEKARDEYENNTSPAFSYGMDVKAGFKLGKKLRLLAGFGYSQNTTRTNTSYVVEQFLNNPKTNSKVELTTSTIFLPALNNSFTADSISVTASAPFDVDYRYRMVSLPIGLQFEQELSKGWDLYLNGGVAANIMVESSVSSSREDIVSVSYDRKDESPFRETHFSGNVGLGLSKQVSDAVSVSIGPEFKSYFNTMLAEPDKAVATQGRPYSIGLNMSLNYQLGSVKK